MYEAFLYTKPEHTASYFIKTIRIVDHNNFNNQIELLLRSYKENTNYTTSKQKNNYAIVPIETENSIVCHIIFTSSFVEDYFVKEDHQLAVIPHLLNTLNFVRFFAHRDFVLRKKNSVLYMAYTFPGINYACEKIIKNYFIHKEQFYSIITLNKHLDNYYNITSPLTSKSFDLSFNEMIKYIYNRVNGVIPKEDSWYNFLHSHFLPLYVNLTINSTINDIIRNPITDNHLLDSFLYKEHIYSYWNQIETLLKNLYNNSLNDYDLIKCEIVKVLEECLKYLGVTYQKQNDHTYMVFFDTSFIDITNHKFKVE